MARKLKTFVTTGGFYELAVAAPSMKAAAELLGVKSNAFSQGFAHETDDAAIIVATMEQPGVLLRRAVGTKGKFAESADLPKLSVLRSAMKYKRAVELPHASVVAKKQKASKKKADTAASRKAAGLYYLAEKRREREERQAAAQLEKKRERHERAAEKAQAALDEARSRYEDRAADIKKQRDALDRKARLEDEHWADEERKLKAALRRAKED